jgi:hypothetical protein
LSTWERIADFQLASATDVFGEGGRVTTITLYKANGDPITYMDPTNVNVENGTLTFYWTKEISGKAQKIITNLPFLIQHDVMGE